MKHRFLSPNFHALLDYLLGMGLIFSPLIFDYYNSGVESVVAVLVGAAAIVITSITCYDFSSFTFVTVANNLMLDIVSGVFLCLSPLIFFFYEHVFLPHVIFGVLLIVNALITKIPGPQKNTCAEDLIFRIKLD